MLSVLLHTPTAAIKTRVLPVLLTGRYAYKIAKLLDRGCVDYTITFRGRRSVMGHHIRTRKSLCDPEPALGLLVESGHELTVLHIRRRSEWRN